MALQGAFGARFCPGSRQGLRNLPIFIWSNQSGCPIAKALRDTLKYKLLLTINSVFPLLFPSCTAKALIEGGINIDVRNIQKMTPLLAACEMASQGNAKGPESIRFITAKMLISYGADICATNGQGSNALHLAVEARPDVHTIWFPLQSGVNVNAKDSRGSTPFHVFCGGSIAGLGTKAETKEVFEL